LHLEPESPRGRIHLVKAAAEGRIELNDRFKEHIYLCLLCRACETACPSGVQYGRIAETAREQLGPPGSPFARAVLNFVFTRLLPYPRRLRFVFTLLRLYQLSGLQRIARSLLPGKLREMASTDNSSCRRTASIRPMHRLVFPQLAIAFAGTDSFRMFRRIMLPAGKEKIPSCSS